MSRIIQLFKNLKYISKINLRKKRLVEFDAEDFVTSILYYIPNSSVLRPNVLDENHTVDLLCKTKKSLARFGDGEISIINGNDIPFQQYDKILANRMREILLNHNNKMLIGINHHYFYPTYNPMANNVRRDFALFVMPWARKTLITCLDLTTDYCDAGFTGIRQEKNTKNDNIFKKMRTIWNKREVVLVGCRQAQEKNQYDLFDNAEKANWIYVPNKNAFSEYDNILAKIKTYSKNAIIILMAGPTGKVLAYDLAQLGYRALDLGHMSKSYDYYMRNVVFTEEAEKDFWKPDL